jgi:hypothetical protein
MQSRPYLSPMRAVLPALLTLLSILPASADPAKAPARHAGAPRSLGKFGEWQAALRSEAGATTCFVFTRAEASPQHIPSRGEAVLSVTRRPRSHDVVAISAGFVLSGHEDAPLQAGGTRMLFYIAGRSAFAHDNAAAIASFGHESSVTARLPGPRGVTATDRFSLKGFSTAYAALNKTCPTS